MYSLDYAPNQITCLFIRSVLLRQKSRHASFTLPAFLKGPLKNIREKPRAPRSPPRCLADSKSTRGVTRSNRFPRALGTLSCSEAAIDLFRAGGIIIAREVEEAGSHFPLCYTCVIGECQFVDIALQQYCLCTRLVVRRGRLQMAGLPLV